MDNPINGLFYFVQIKNNFHTIIQPFNCQCVSINRYKIRKESKNFSNEAFILFDFSQAACNVYRRLLAMMMRVFKTAFPLL